MSLAILRANHCTFAIHIHASRTQQSKATSHFPNDHSSDPSRSYALSAVTICTERIRGNTASNTPPAYPTHPPTVYRHLLGVFPPCLATV